MIAINLKDGEKIEVKQYCGFNKVLYVSRISDTLEISLHETSIFDESFIPYEDRWMYYKLYDDEQNELGRIYEAVFVRNGKVQFK